MTLAHALKIRSDTVQSRILKLDDELALEPLYKDATTGLARDFDSFYKKGRYQEATKKDVIMRDLEAKQEHIMELLKEKEAYEEQLAPFGNIHHIYVRNVIS